jgi:hypothetical protein
MGRLVGVLGAGVLELLAIETPALAILFGPGPGTFRLVAAKSGSVLRSLSRCLDALALPTEFAQIDEIAHCCRRSTAVAA